MGLLRGVAAEEATPSADGSNTRGSGAHERVSHQLPLSRALLDEDPKQLGGLLGGIAAMDSRHVENIRDAKVI